MLAHQSTQSQLRAKIDSVYGFCSCAFVVSGTIQIKEFEEWYKKQDMAAKNDILDLEMLDALDIPAST